MPENRPVSYWKLTLPVHNCLVVPRWKKTARTVHAGRLKKICLPLVVSISAIDQISVNLFWDLFSASTGQTISRGFKIAMLGTTAGQVLTAVGPHVAVGYIVGSSVQFVLWLTKHVRLETWVSESLLICGSAFPTFGFAVGILEQNDCISEKVRFS